MMISPELFAEEHDGHERIDEARACLDYGMVWFQYCQDCDLLGYAADEEAVVLYGQQLTLRAIGEVFIVAAKRLADMPPKQGETTDEIIERIRAKAKKRNLTT